MSHRLASFDCAKAYSATEKLICDDPELSRLDEELAHAYADALKRAEATEKKEIQSEQVTWLRLRDVCQRDLQCVVTSYRDRLRDLNGFRTSPSVATETVPLQREADRLASIQQAFKTALREQPSSYNRYPQYPFCVKFFEDLAAARGMKAIEPSVRAESADAPGLAKWHRCDGAEEADVADPTSPYLGLYMLGGPPYRYYRVDPKGKSKEGEKDFLYHNLYWHGTHLAGHLGYTWVDIKKCTVKDGASLSHTVLASHLSTETRSMSAIVNYRSEVVVIELIAEYSDSNDDKAYWVMAHRFGKHAPPPQCPWY